MNEKKQYQLRYAAGIYWLICMDQRWDAYEPPRMLNACGAAIWERLQKGNTKEEIAAYLADEYEIEAERAQHDVDEFLNHLEEQGIL